MGRRKIIQKRTTLLQKLAYILRPFVVYMVVKTLAMFTLALLIPSLPIAGIEEWVEENSYQLSAAINGLASLIAVCFLLDAFLKEAVVSGEIDIDAGVPRQLFSFIKSLAKDCAAKWKPILVWVVFGVVCAFLLNFLISFLSEAFARVSQVQGTLGSEKYETVAQIQYSVPYAAGLLLYGLVAPFAEEIVFRGIIFNRIKKFYGIGRAVLFSALLFGVFHANLPQFVYGACMGALLALCYERTECFAAPFLLHMAVNAAVFSAAFVM